MTRTNDALAWRRPVAAIVLATALTVLAMVFTGMGPRLALVTTLGGLVGAAVWLIARLSTTTTPAEPWPRRRPTTPATTRASAHVSTLRARIAHGSHAGGTERVHALLVELLDDQLAAAHGIDRATDPAAARAILGDELFSFATDPTAARSIAKRRNLEGIVARIEAL